MVESYKLKFDQSEEENEELKLRLKNMEKQILEGSSLAPLTFTQSTVCQGF